MIVIGGKSAARADPGYIPQKVCCKDSSARGMGVALRYIMSASSIIDGMNFSCSTYNVPGSMLVNLVSMIVRY